MAGWRLRMMSDGSDLGQLRELAAKLARRTRADILLYRGDIVRSADVRLSSERRGRRGRRNVLLVLSTLGGSPDTAYRIARSLQREYERLTVYIDDYCKAAGTLLALSADELVISEFGELGPLDIASHEPVESGQMTSGMATLQALNRLRSEAFAFFESCSARLAGRTRSPSAARAAADAASGLAIGLFSPVFAQIEPTQLGDVDRAVRTALGYGARLGENKLREGALERLVADYPSHDFVIDRQEAEELFRNVRGPTPDEAEFLKQVEPIVGDRGHQSRLIYLDEFLEMAPPMDEEGGEPAERVAAPSGADAPAGTAEGRSDELGEGT